MDLKFVEILLSRYYEVWWTVSYVVRITWTDSKYNKMFFRGRYYQETRFFSMMLPHGKTF